MTPSSGRSPGEGIGYSLQYSCTSMEAQSVKNPPATQKTWVQPLGWKDSLEEGMTAHSSILAWIVSWTKEPGSPWGHKESDTTELLSLYSSSNS